MTEEELDAAIAEIIIPQEKPRSTQNSHRRKQWENRRYWHLCTVGESCKIGVIKSCKIARQKKAELNRDRIPICRDCYGYFGLFSIGRMGGIYNHDCNTHYRKFSYKHTGYRRCVNRWFRRYESNIENEIGNYGYYKKIFEYKWDCF